MLVEAFRKFWAEESLCSPTPELWWVLMWKVVHSSRLKRSRHESATGGGELSFAGDMVWMIAELLRQDE